MSDSREDRGPPSGNRIVVALDVGPEAAQVARAGRDLADALGRDWEAVHVETPGGHDQDSAAEALGFAASLGSTVAKVPAATVAAGLATHLESAGATHLVIGKSGRRRRLLHRPTLLDEIAGPGAQWIVHVVPTGMKTEPARVRAGEGVAITNYAYAVGAVALTAALALALNRTAAIHYVSFLFFLPVIASAARLGTKPAIVAAIVGSAAFNFLFVDPIHVLKPAAVQSWIMTAALVAVALYTGAVTANLRARATLSERSAQENASVASFVAELTRAADWESTAAVICSGIGALLDVQAVLVRDLDGSLTLVASAPAGIELDPLDRTALEWAWSHGEPAGSGSAVLSAVNWHFEPLVTSLGTLAVLGLARPDGRNPIPAFRRLLLSTLVAQSALALERLRLEDAMKAR